MTNTTNSKAIQKIIRNYRVDLKSGNIYNHLNQQIGSNTYEPRASVRLNTRTGRKKYNTRISRVIGYVKFGPAALAKGSQIRHIDGDKSNNSGDNLTLVRLPNLRGDITAAQIRRVRSLTKSGRYTVGDIADRTSTSRHQVRRIASGLAYTEVV